MAYRSSHLVVVLALVCLCFATPAQAFGAGYVAKGASNAESNFRHGDILQSVYFLTHAHSVLVRQIYFGNFLSDFSQLLDAKAIDMVPEPILRAVVSIFAYLQFGYTTKEFEVTPERLGYYRPEEHIDNPKGYDGGRYAALRPVVRSEELDIDSKTGMKSYIGNRAISNINDTARDHIERQLVAAIACGRARDSEAYTHLGAALHTLEDFTAHSNWVELCMQMLSTELHESSAALASMRNVFAFTGGSAWVTTARGRAPPLTTGTFGALDLYQTVLGEFDDKLTSLSLPGLQMRMKGSDESLSATSRLLIDTFSNLDKTDFASDIQSITKSATQQPADWGKLSEAPHLLWESLYPVFRVRDKIVRWVYDHLTINAVADAVATISTALDKLVYRIIGTFLGPVLKDISAALVYQTERLQAQDQQARLAKGEQSIFDASSHATDPTHSQLCKDHYDHDLNELAGRVATKITTYTIKQVVEIWQPGSTVEVKPVLDAILEALHHPFNYTRDSQIQALMVAEVLNWCTTKFQQQPEAFAAMVSRLSRENIAAKLDEETQQIEHSHVPSMTAAYAAPNQISGTTAHDLTTMNAGGANIGFIERIATNLEKNIGGGKFSSLSVKDIPVLKDILYSKPSAETPNPIDSSLTRIPGIGLLSVFEGIDIGEIVAAPGMGIILKDAVIAMRLQDAEWVEREQTAAQQRLGSLEDRPVKQMLQLLDFGAEPKSQDRPVEEDESKTAKLLSKLKLHRSKDD